MLGLTLPLIAAANRCLLATHALSANKRFTYFWLRLRFLDMASMAEGVKGLILAVFFFLPVDRAGPFSCT
jgi:hypothetical protein